LQLYAVIIFLTTFLKALPRSILLKKYDVYAATNKLLEILKNADYYNWRRMIKIKAQTKDSPLLEALKAEALKACF